MAVKWTVEIEIADVWIADGFRLDAVELADALDSELLGGFAQEGEIICRVVKEPTQAAINQAINRHDADVILQRQLDALAEGLAQEEENAVHPK